MELLGTNRWDPLVNGGKCTMSELRVKLFNFFFYLFIWLYQMAWGLSSCGLIAPGHVGSEFPTRD